MLQDFFNIFLMVTYVELIADVVEYQINASSLIAISLFCFSAPELLLGIIEW